MSSVYKIKTAGLICELKVYGELLRSRIEPYIYKGDEKPDIIFEVTDAYYKDRNIEYPHLTFEECEYLWSGAYFYEKLCEHGGVMLHSSCVEYENKAYLFSADSGVGKSTHTHLWLKYLEGSRIINDDKPAIRCIDGVYMAFGTPWSGKNPENIDIGVKIAGIAFLSRGKNEIHKINGISAMRPFMEQTVRPNDKSLMGKMLDVLNGILENVPFYEFTCDMSKEAVLTSYNFMKGNCNG